MNNYDFIQEYIIPAFKGDYKDFSSKKIEGYSLFVSEWKKKTQAMVTTEGLEHLHFIVRKFVNATAEKEENLYKSQISRWYVNGFTSAYNYCRRYDLNNPHEETDFAIWAKKLRLTDDLEQGVWNKDKFRKHTIHFGQQEGTLFYVAERNSLETSDKLIDDDTAIKTDIENPSETEVTPETGPSYIFPDGLIEELYEEFNDSLFRKISTLGEFNNIITRKPHSERLSECPQKKMQMYKLLYSLHLKLPDSIRKQWLTDIANECGYKVEIIEKKHTGSDSSTDKYSKTMEHLDAIFDKH